jgi:hypothetical protein
MGAPLFGQEFQAKADREIPVVVLEPRWADGPRLPHANGRLYCRTATEEDV